MFKSNILKKAGTLLWKISGHQRNMDTASEMQRILVSKDEAPDIEIIDLPYSKYGGESTVTLYTGTHDIGKQGAYFIKKVFDHINAPVQLELLSGDTDIEDEFMLSAMRNGTAIHIDPDHSAKAKKKSLILNTNMDLYASVVNCFAIPGFGAKFPKVDIVIVMQNNKGDFSKMEYEPVKGVVETLKIAERKALYRYIDYAFKYAIKHNRKRITFGHKKLELPLSDGLHMKTAKKLQETKYPEIQIDFMFINTVIRNLTWNASAFDVLCLNENYGTFVTSVASGVCGGANLFAASEVGDHYAIFKPLQTKLSLTMKELSAYGCIITAVNLLKHLRYNECASKLWRGLLDVMVAQEKKTKYYGGSCSENDIIDSVIGSIQTSTCRFA